MNDELLDGLVSLAQDDWLPLWVIVDDVQELLGIENPEEVLEATVTLVKQLMKRGLLAGDSPVENFVHFQAWRDQDPDAVADYIRREWRERDDLPAWGDGPWFAFPPKRHAAA